jgi:hypothetical protein
MLQRTRIRGEAAGRQGTGREMGAAFSNETMLLDTRSGRETNCARAFPFSRDMLSVIVGAERIGI